MRLIFDPALDGPSWPGPLGGRPAVLGEAWLGSMGLLGLLETQLGVGGPVYSGLERACHLAASLRNSTGYWRASYERDPVGTARRLLKDRDLLRLWNWAGEPVSARLDQLWLATLPALPGLPDRLAAVIAALDQRRVDVQSIELYAAVETLAPLWRRVLSALARAGVSIMTSRVPSAPAAGDLGNAKAPGFRPQGDGSLCLLRRHGVLDLADEVAATLAAFDKLDDVVIIGADAVLDRALGRHGLPRLGRDVDTVASSQLLPLVIEAAFEPMAASDLHALLVLDPGPIPRGVAAHLLGALRIAPSRRAKRWQEALAAGVALYPENHDQLAARVTALTVPFGPPEVPLPVAELKRRLAVIRRWAAGRAASDSTLIGVVHQTTALERAVDLLGVTALSRHELRRLLGDLGEMTFTAASAESGLADVVHPGAILAPARVVIWWNFSRGHAPRPAHLFLTQDEERALRASGVEPPDIARLMEGEAQRWRRPLQLTTGALVLACPHTDESGERCHPHPFWDEVVASLPEPNDIGRLETTTLAKIARPVTISASLRPLIKPAAQIAIPGGIPLREAESPSSLERLIGCSFSWALHYHAGLRPGLSDGPARVDPRLLGSMAHELLAQVFAHRPVDATNAAERADALFDAQMAELCEEIALATHQVDRASLKHAVVETARVLTEIVAEVGAEIVGSEVAHDGTALGHKMHGQLDLVLTRPDFIIDLKWGKGTTRNKLETGTSVQLAAYAAMRRETAGVGDVGVGYFLLRSQELLTEVGAGLSGGRAIGRHTNREVWNATLEELAARRTQLAAGSLHAPGAGGDELESALEGSKLRLAPNCEYCEFAGLCGREGAR